MFPFTQNGFGSHKPSVRSNLAGWRSLAPPVATPVVLPSMEWGARRHGEAIGWFGQNCSERRQFGGGNLEVVNSWSFCHIFQSWFHAHLDLGVISMHIYIYNHIYIYICCSLRVLDLLDGPGRPSLLTRLARRMWTASSSFQRAVLDSEPNPLLNIIKHDQTVDTFRYRKKHDQTVWYHIPMKLS